VSFELIRVERIGTVAKIVLNRPERLNACPPAMAVEVCHALATLGDARAVLLTGEGRAFCSGADLAVAGAGSIAGGQASYDSLVEAYNPMIARLSDCPVPVVVAVNGPAAGVGCSLALAGDFTLAGRSAYFLQAFVNIGLVPDGGSSWILPRLIGKARAAQMMMLGERVGAQQAQDWGLIYKAVDDEALADEAMALATRLGEGPSLALGLMRQTLAYAIDSDLASAMQREAEGQRKAADSADAAEGIQAFLEKRKPRFIGR
jgi:2-(1,2-epoxy-1,2-dihydrophenyl)acetyl-CoA isomerase